MGDNFLVKTETFEGPLDLLLHLIEKRKLLINEISLAQITDDYISHIQNSNDLSIKKNAHFILTASTLVLIKSKSILPTLDLSSEEEASIEDLEKRLKVLKRIKDTEHHLEEMFDTNPSFFRLSGKSDEATFAPPKSLGLLNLTEAISNVLKSIPKKEKIPQTVVRKVISLEESISTLTRRIKQNISMSFRDFSNFGKEDRVNVVVSFLAMLELVKQGTIEVMQDNQYGDIDMQTKEFDIPNYS